MKKKKERRVYLPRVLGNELAGQFFERIGFRLGHPADAILAAQQMAHLAAAGEHHSAGPDRDRRAPSRGLKNSVHCLLGKGPIRLISCKECLTSDADG
jgi:hypothetical protein